MEYINYKDDIKNNVYAFNKKGHEIHISQAFSGANGYYCMGCKGEMQAVISRQQNRISYFRHAPKDVNRRAECTYSDETYRHKLAKAFLQELKKIKVPAVYKYPPAGVEGKVNKLKESQFIEAHHIGIEKTFYEDSDGKVTWTKRKTIDEKSIIIRPDVTFFNKDGRPILFIELVATHKVSFEKRARIRALGVAPTYFECTNIKDDLKRDYALIDGGVYANNPTLCAYAEARSLFKKPDTQKAVTAADMLILSVGTGNDKKTYPYQKAKNWGQAEWVKPIIDIMMSGVAETVDYQVRQIYDAIEHSSNYLRVDAPLPNTVNHDMDDASEENMQALKKQGELVAQKFKKQLEDFAKTIVETDGCERIY